MTKFISRFARIAACLALASSAAACATVTRGTSQDFTVESEPSGAAVTTTNGFSCEATPCTFHMARRSNFDVTLTKEGYEPATAHVGNRVAGAGAAGIAGNVLIGGVIGLGVDAASGAALDLTPNPLQVTLTPVGQAPAGGASTEGAAAAPAAPAGQ